MKFLPEFETVKKFAESGKYDIVPVSCEILSDICTPIEAIKKLDALLEYAVMHGDEKEAERIREELRKLADEG